MTDIGSAGFATCQVDKSCANMFHALPLGWLSADLQRRGRFYWSRGAHHFLWSQSDLLNLISLEFSRRVLGSYFAHIWNDLVSEKIKNKKFWHKKKKKSITYDQVGTLFSKLLFFWVAWLHEMLYMYHIDVIYVSY